MSFKRILLFTPVKCGDELVREVHRLSGGHGAQTAHNYKLISLYTMCKQCFC